MTSDEHNSQIELFFSLPAPDAIRAAIDVTDERARLLRRLLRLALRLKLNLTTGDRLLPPAATRQEVTRG